eukprot:TRINITY_DN5287_c1_g3_i1.p1 TRINITY_DN5287_c1_g3~~TRINITY_DN5287_c1_g3_i1.p1  ORF type:complete len:150 (-),score=21.14 TRINITY_DN5287_c1_g3_i1:690-1139(-)
MNDNTENIRLILKGAIQSFQKNSELYSNLRNYLMEKVINTKNSFSIPDTIKDEPMEYLFDISSIPNDEDNVFLLPVLESLPKECPDPQNTKFIIQERTLDIFSGLWHTWFKNFHTEGYGYSPYGHYLAGPNGVGKSITLYQLCCMFRCF